VSRPRYSPTVIALVFRCHRHLRHHNGPVVIIGPPSDTSGFFLLDDDPFANHTSARPLPFHRSNPTSPTPSRRTSVKQPRSPLAAEKCLVASPSHSISSSVSTQCSQSPSSPPRMSPPPLPISGRQLRPAYTRPAFAPRPSLPSLHSLAQSDFVYPIKVCNIPFLPSRRLTCLLDTKRHTRGASSPRALGCERRTGKCVRGSGILSRFRSRHRPPPSLARPGTINRWE
jgi:hypothetical protein